ncbi:hypothetical protein ZWY2020_011485 [Hordeum vulgare]|nr:hypothetical protein ZWY2020_011485 [Hordeum vulgare]
MPPAPLRSSPPQLPPPSLPPARASPARLPRSFRLPKKEGAATRIDLEPATELARKGVTLLLLEVPQVQMVPPGPALRLLLLPQQVGTCLSNNV